MQATEAVESSKVSLLRPNQVEDYKSEIKSAEEKLQSKHIQDKGEVAKQLRRLKAAFESQVPRPPETGEEEDSLVRRGKQLLDEILVGMPSQEEMRKAPPGAVDKHMKWEARNKAKIQEWKNIQLRLTAGSNEREAANLERFRPTGSTLNMDNAFIQGKQFFLPPYGASLGVTFSAEQIAFLKANGVEVGVMNNLQRQEVKDVLVSGGIGVAAEAGYPPVTKKNKGGRPKKKPAVEQQKA
jgi:hypothetical protein